ncbi:pantoate--beta-alanine ligase [Yunchengibacter salinarum]|uniref:pantoate--beta-alanine ligase n=1 Tax=Yunchengibacter salinarum TaxID=3133399 RepID=UPI0035B69498
MSNTRPDLIETPAALAAQADDWHRTGLTIGLVPTMGALHAGHLSLVREIAPYVDKVVVSIFVNPTQFGEGEDFERYPRTLDSDMDALKDTPATHVYSPAADAIYPPGFNTLVHVTGLTERFEGAARPGHFDGVATVVAKLLNQSRADVAIFGEKDFQQLAVIRAMVRDLDMPVRILGGSLVREADGLAASSRNAYLDADQRRIAASLNRVLATLKAAIEKGEDARIAEKAAEDALFEAGFDRVDYISLVDPDSLTILESADRPARLIAVARLGGIRLLDNMAVAPAG